MLPLKYGLCDIIFKLSFFKILFSTFTWTIMLRASWVTQMVKNLAAMQEIQVWSLGQEGPLEKRTAAYSNILAWRITWTEEPGRLQSMVLQRVERDWVTNTFTFICCVRWAAKWSFPLLILWNGQIHFKRIWSLPGNFLFSQAEHKMKSERNVYKDY